MSLMASLQYRLVLKWRPERLGMPFVLHWSGHFHFGRRRSRMSWSQLLYFGSFPHLSILLPWTAEYIAVRQPFTVSLFDAMLKLYNLKLIVVRSVRSSHTTCRASALEMLVYSDVASNDSITYPSLIVACSSACRNDLVFFIMVMGKWAAKNVGLY